MILCHVPEPGGRRDLIVSAIVGKRNADAECSARTDNRLSEALRGSDFAAGSNEPKRQVFSNTRFNCKVILLTDVG